MNQEVKEKWVKALKSGKYGQCKKQLKSENNKFCCLGVLQDIYIKKNKFKWHRDGGYGTFNGGNAAPANQVVQWAEMENINFQDFWNLNDEQNLTFPEIALYIENGL